jgi:hypothetical protein
MWLNDTPHLHGLAGRYGGSTPCATQREIKPYTARQIPAHHEVFGYPAAWPAGPWMLPLFWVVVLCGAWVLRSLG